MQLLFQDKFREELGIYYERQEGAFENLRDDDLQRLGVQPGRAIEIKRLAHALLAAQGEIDKFSRLADVFESEKL